MKKEKHTERSNESKLSMKNKWRYAIILGVIGALFWSGIGYLSYWLNFMRYSPSHFGKPFINSSYIFRWEGILFSLTIIMLLSILFSLLYAYIFSHLYTPWIGIFLGAILWYIFVGWRKPDMHSFYTSLSIFLLYGVFIGYSLSVEFSDPEKKKRLNES